MIRNNLQFSQSKKSQQVSNNQQLQSVNLEQLDGISGGNGIQIPITVKHNI